MCGAEVLRVYDSVRLSVSIAKGLKDEELAGAESEVVAVAGKAVAEDPLSLAARAYKRGEEWIDHADLGDQGGDFGVGEDH